jgi:hypothetical protein
VSTTHSPREDEHRVKEHMGGRGPGHKSEKARQARMRNIYKARGARKRLPLPWRSGLESRIIEQLAGQWWNSPEPRKWPAYRVARLWGVSHTWIAKLVKRFRADPDRMRRPMRAFAPADFEELQRARQETRWQRERGWLRTAVVPTKSEKRRDAQSAASRGAPGVPAQRTNTPRRSALRVAPMTELPPWARGIIPDGKPRP